MMMIAVLYQIIMFIGDPILLGGFKLVYEVLDMYGLLTKCFGNGADSDFILDCSH